MQAQTLEAQLLEVIKEAEMAVPQGDTDCTPTPAIGLPTICYTPKRSRQDLAKGAAALCEDPLVVQDRYGPVLAQCCIVSRCCEAVASVKLRRGKLPVHTACGLAAGPSLVPNPGGRACSMRNLCALWLAQAPA